jgi:hypothetical protein
MYDDHDLHFSLNEINNDLDGGQREALRLFTYSKALLERVR